MNLENVSTAEELKVSEMTKPIIKYSKYLSMWVCFDGNSSGVGNTPEMAYRDFIYYKTRKNNSRQFL